MNLFPASSSCHLCSGVLGPEEAVAALQHHLDHCSETGQMLLESFKLESHDDASATGTHLCLFSVTLCNSKTSLERGERTGWTPHSSRTAITGSGPAVRASISVRLSGSIFLPLSSEPPDQLLPLTLVTCSDSTSPLGS